VNPGSVKAEACGLVRAGLENPLLAVGEQSAIRNRETFVNNVSRMLGHIPPPTYWPLSFIDCMDCGRLHFLHDASCLWKPKQKSVPA
jgi:hypothetical protein